MVVCYAGKGDMEVQALSLEEGCPDEVEQPPKQFSMSGLMSLLPWQQFRQLHTVKC